MSLADRLKLGTHALHREVERSGMMPAFLRGTISRERYCLLLRNLHAIYSSLEAALTEHRQSPAIEAIHSPALARSAALAADLDHLHGSGWQTALPLTTPARRYAAHLQALAAEAPSKLVAHAYVRYLGDLNGGQILRRIARAALRLPETGDGTRFHEFAAPGVDALAAAFRAGLDHIVLPEAELDAIVREAQCSFRLHAELFEALAAA